MDFKLNSQYKYRYIKVREKGPFGLTIARVDVSVFNKKGVKLAWDEEDRKSPPDKYITCLEENNEELPCFDNRHKL